jgi:hypothetical protein
MIPASAGALPHRLAATGICHLRSFPPCDDERSDDACKHDWTSACNLRVRCLSEERNREMRLPVVSRDHLSCRQYSTNTLTCHAMIAWTLAWTLHPWPRLSSKESVTSLPLGILPNTSDERSRRRAGALECRTLVPTECQTGGNKLCKPPESSQARSTLPKGG